MGTGQLCPGLAAAPTGTALYTGGETRLLRVAATSVLVPDGAAAAASGVSAQPTARLLGLQAGGQAPLVSSSEVAYGSELPSTAGQPEPQPPAPFPPWDLVSYFFGLWFSERNQHINDFFPSEATE